MKASAKVRQLEPVNGLKNLPHDFEAEKFFLGSIFVDNGVLDREVLTPEDFHLEIHRQIYKSMLELWCDGAGIDPVTLANWMEKSAVDLGGGRRIYIAELSEIVPTACNANCYARILREKPPLRRAKLLAASLDKAVNEGNPEKTCKSSKRSVSWQNLSRKMTDSSPLMSGCASLPLRLLRSLSLVISRPNPVSSG
ncbi:MAG: hypothetical protein M0Z25_01020 [Nitrospiraceae bacterium]|nr:hypothetical protein [Nitrospiraceae bacterium]